MHILLNINFYVTSLSSSTFAYSVYPQRWPLPQVLSGHGFLHSVRP